jgi:uncharacterized protein (DUF885 family)
MALAFIAGCNTSAEKKSTEVSDINEAFNNYKQRFMEYYWEVNPASATYSGYHKFDNVLNLPDTSELKKQLIFCQQQLDSLKSFDYSLLNKNNKTDYRLIENEMLSTVFYLTELKQSEWNPSVYNLGGLFFEIINYKGHTLEKRLEDISQKLEKIPAYYQTAKSNINNPTKEHTGLAIQQIKGSVSVFESTLKDSVAASSLLQEEKNSLNRKLDTAIGAINEFVVWLEKEILPGIKNETARSFRIGKDMYEKKFAHDIQSSFSAEEIYNKAIEYKNTLHAKMLEISIDLWPKYMKSKPMPKDSLLLIKEMIDVLSVKHAHRDSFIQSIEKQIPELTEFINNKQLLWLDPEKPLVVRETPLYMRGVAGASISSPGPYDANAETFYNVTPLDEYSEEQAESYLREYNEYVLQILNIHEAIPGHYAQLVYSNKSPSIIKSVFGNGAMVEGWAVYTELMMLEEGYKNSPEMWLMYYKWNLRTVCNTILDYSVHVLGINEKDALNLLMKEAFQQEAEAKGKWKRVTLTQVQLCSYFTGYYEIYHLREGLKQKLGDKFLLKDFHEKFLSYGSAPVKYIREMMLEETKNENP